MAEDLDSILVAKIIRKERLACREAITLYQPVMRALASRIVGSALAEEVVQEAWISIMKGLPSFQGKSSLKTWILAIVANEAKMRLRKEKPSVSLEELSESGFSSRFDDAGAWKHPPLQWELNSPESILAADELNDCLSLTIDTLPQMQASVLQLRETEGMKFDEICNILQISESNVRVLVHRARQKLYQVIEHFQSTGDCLSSQ